MISRLTNGLRHLASFFRRQKVRSNVLITDAEDTGQVAPQKQADRYLGLVKYRAYPLTYVLIGTEPLKGNPEKVVYRFFDPATKTEFLLTKALVDLLFYWVPPDSPSPSIKDENRQTIRS